MDLVKTSTTNREGDAELQNGYLEDTQNWGQTDTHTDMFKVAL